jgi:isorenieratene synthase
MIKKLIKTRLKGYKQQFNRVDTSLPLKLTSEKKVAVIGSGLAGMSAAAYLAPRGFGVEVFEKDSYIGGKIGSWPVTFTDGFQTNVEHGFHGFFRQYHNLLRLLETVQSAGYLIPISDYLIKTQTHGEFSFRSIETTPVLNLVSMARHGIYSLSDMMSVKKAKKMMPLLRYNRKKTFAKFDKLSFKDFSDALALPKELQLVFTTFSRAFFSEPQYMSMAELIKSFHFYFLSNDLGILYDVLDDDFEKTLWQPFQNFLHPYGTQIHLNSPVDQIGYEKEKFVIRDRIFDYLILASDVKNTPVIIKNSTTLRKFFPNATKLLANVKSSQKYAVLRIWIDKDVQGELPFFIFTDALKILDSVTIYHQMEKTSADWVKENGGGIFELHSYAVPNDMTNGDDVRQQLVSEFETYFPEIKGCRILYEYFQFRDDFTAFHTNLYKSRPEYITEVPNLFLAGDWVKLPLPAMLMEAATTSALFAANEILKKEKLREEQVLTVPLKGVLA